MKRGETILICVLGGIALGTSAWASTGDAPAGRYQGIVERNVFNLKPPPPAVPPEPPAAPPPKITLTGITTILGPKKALMRVMVPAKPPEPAKEESYILAEEEGRAGVQVLEIDEKGGTVKVNNHGTVQSLDFRNDGAKQVAVAAPPPTLAVPPPVVMPPVPTPGTPPPGPAGRTIPTRTMRLPSAPGTGGQPMSGLPGGLPAGVPNQPGVNPQMASDMNADVQTVVIEAQRLKYQQEGNPAAVILPPTSLTPLVNGGKGGSVPTARP